MKYWGLLFLLLLPALADGMHIPADPSLFYNVVEDQQIAVIDVKDNQRVAVDLFVSLTDKSNESHEIKFILPFNEKPLTFNVTEESSNSFSKRKTAELDSLITKYQTWRVDAKNNILKNLFLVNAAFGNPLGSLLLVQSSSSMAAMGGRSHLEEIITTEHTRTEVYNVEEQGDLKAVLEKSGLPESVQATMMKFTGKYLYFITMKTIPSAGEGRGLNNMGVDFSFQAQMTPKEGQYEYSYPLSTGAAWGNPIRLTRVYIKAPETVQLFVEYPHLNHNLNEMEMARMLLEGEIYPAFGMSSVNSPTTQVKRLTYTDSNPSEDILVKVNYNPDIGTLLFVISETALMSLSEFSLPIFALAVAGIWVLFFRLDSKSSVKNGVVCLISYLFGAWVLVVSVGGGVLLASGLGYALYGSTHLQIVYNVNYIVTLLLPISVMFFLLFGSVFGSLAAAFAFKKLTASDKIPFWKFFFITIKALVVASLLSVGVFSILFI